MGEKWIRQFSLGCPITWEMPQRRVYQDDGGNTALPPRSHLCAHLLPVSRNAWPNLATRMPKHFGAKQRHRWTRGGSPRRPSLIRRVSQLTRNPKNTKYRPASAPNRAPCFGRVRRPRTQIDRPQLSVQDTDTAGNAGPHGQAIPRDVSEWRRVAHV